MNHITMIKTASWTDEQIDNWKRLLRAKGFKVKLNHQRSWMTLQVTE